MGPELYSLVGVCTVVSGLILSFSHLGVETTMMRGALYWMEKGEIEKVREYTTQSFLSRMIGFVILFPFVVLYLLYICYNKYNGNYLTILLFFYFGACASALNDSMSLIIRAQGNYLFSQAAKTINSSIVKFLAIFVYLKFGAMPYLYFYCLIPIPLFFVFYLKIRDNLDFRYISFSETVKKIKESRNLWLKSYMDYFTNYADNLLVSVLFPPSIMGLYTLYKNIETIAKGFIEGFLDVIVQRLVRYKGNVERLVEMERKASLIRWGLVCVVVLLAGIFLIHSEYIISLVNLSKYDGVYYSILIVAVVSILCLIGKNENNLIALMAPSDMVFKMGVFMFFVTIFSFISVFLFPTIWGVYSQRIVAYGLTSFIGLLVFRIKRLDYFTNVYK